MKGISIHEKYQPLWTSDSRFFIVTGGRGSGKSFAVALFLNMQTYEKGHKTLFTRYTMKSTDESIMAEFREKVEMMGSSDDFRITKDTITNIPNESSIMFRGIRTSSGNQTAALKSITGLTTWVMDEAEELTDEDTFDKIQRSVRVKGKRNRIIIVMNPSTKDHFIFKRFFEDMNVEPGWNGTKEDVTYIHTTYEDNIDNVDESFILDNLNMKRRRPDKYEHEVLGGWKLKADGAIITNWKVGNYVELENQCYGQDFGFSDDPTTLVQCALDMKARKLYVRSIYGKKGLTTQQIVRQNRIECGYELIMADSSEPRLIEELRNFGINVRAVKKKHGSIKSGIAMLQDMEIIVDPSSTEIIKELNNYAWHEKGEKPIDKHNHYIDAIRYALTRLYTKRSFGKYVLR